MSEITTPLDTVTDPSVTDPLSEVTRKERKSLLGSCVVGLAIVIGRLVPEKIQAFGITVSSSQERSLLYLLAAVLLYFLLAFGVYAWADLQRRKTIFSKAQSDFKPIIDKASQKLREVQESWKEFDDPEATSALFENEDFIKLSALTEQAKLAGRVSRVGTVRVVFDVALPILIGLFSISVVLYHTRGFPGWQWVVGALLLSGASGAVVGAWKNRVKIRRWFLKKRRARRDRRFRRIAERLKKLPEDHPERAKLQEISKKNLERIVEDIKKGDFF